VRTAQPADEVEAERPRLFGLAYRLLGSASEAEDAVQDAFLRWTAADPAAIEKPPAWLTRVVTNLCLNRLASASRRREKYVGVWLPEPVLTDGGALGPLETIEQRESVSFALLVLLERLTPAERAAFVLREAFGYTHRQVAEVLGLSEANCRQLDHRARRRLAEGRSRFETSVERWRRLAERFIAAAWAGDLEGLERLLAEDVTTWSDGGGKVVAARRPVSGRARVARYLAGLAGKFGAGITVSAAEVNGQPALLTWIGEVLVGVLVPELVDGRLHALRMVLNPEKLAFASRQAAPLSRSAVAPGHSF
jgi:RNA polymerase sigma-70 factor (TIGR02957 family)